MIRGSVMSDLPIIHQGQCAREDGLESLAGATVPLAPNAEICPGPVNVPYYSFRTAPKRFRGPSGGWRSAPAGQRWGADDGAVY